MAKQMIERNPTNCIGGSPERKYIEIGNVTIPKLKKLFQLRIINVYIKMMTEKKSDKPNITANKIPIHSPPHNTFNIRYY